MICAKRYQQKDTEHIQNLHETMHKHKSVHFQNLADKK